MFEQPSIFPPNLKITNHKPLIILGMHRSGTSLLAHWLTNCGFNLGEEMIGPGNGNVNGHFEDLDLYRLHETILRKNNRNYKLREPVSLNYNQKLRNEAMAIYDKRKSQDCWGWKEPRTCLTMDLWKEIIPSYNCLIVYRDYHQVVDSFIRRKQKAIQSLQNPFEKAIQKAKYQFLQQSSAQSFLDVWIEYNRRILEEVSQLASKNFLVISESKLPHLDYMVFNYLRQEWNYNNIEFSPIAEIHRANMLTRQTQDYSFYPEQIRVANILTEELKSLEHQTFLKLHLK